MTNQLIWLAIKSGLKIDDLKNFDLEMLYSYTDFYFKQEEKINNPKKAKTGKTYSTAEDFINM